MQRSETGPAGGGFEVLGTAASYVGGDVGIGTTTPSVYGHGGTARVLEIRNPGTSVHSQAHLVLSSGVANLENSSLGTVTWAHGGQMVGYIGAYTRGTDAAHPAGALALGTRDSTDNAPQVRMLISEYGNIAIGGTVTVGGGLSEGAKLFVNSDSDTGPAISGYGRLLPGLVGKSGAFHGVMGYGQAPGMSGVYGTTTSPGGFGGNFVNSEGTGLRGVSAAGTGVEGASDVGWAVWGHSGRHWGMYGESDGNDGVAGRSSADGKSGVYGFTERPGGFGVYGFSKRHEGVHGHSDEGDGVVGGTLARNKSGVFGFSHADSAFGVYGFSKTHEGVHGQSASASSPAVKGYNESTGPGVYGESAQGLYGGFFKGRVRVGTLEIAGGADLSEPFAVSRGSIGPGSVVVIDDENPGKLRESTAAYDRRVAGVISGAKGLSPGISMQQEGHTEKGQDVALTGRVYVSATTANGPIRPGDLLTTSDSAGKAMKVTDHARAQGAILGKAMSSLDQETGLVLILVTLQ